MSQNDGQQAPGDFEGLSDVDIAWFMMEMMEGNRRLYDVLLSLLSAQTSADKARELQAMHERGEFLFPPAWTGDQGGQDAGS